MRQAGIGSPAGGSFCLSLAQSHHDWQGARVHILAERLGRRFGRKYALRDAAFESRGGEIVALIGNNGAGKTTLLQLLAGLLVPTHGSLLLDGRPLDRTDESLRRRMAIIPDFPTFFATHTVLEHIAMVCALHHVPEEGLETRVVELMRGAGIFELGRARMVSLSRGQIYKAVFVSLLLARPDLWLVDEPMASGMDPQGLSFLRAQLREQATAGATIFYSTQIAEIAERFSDRVFVIREGRILTDTSAAEIVAFRGVPTLEEAVTRLLGDG